MPISYEKPKALISVKGEVLIERQIKQLLNAGITEIYIVVGYMMEKFLYLTDKFGVKIIHNPEYSKRNNNFSIWLARENLGNTYICSSDNYFTENVFTAYVYQSYYALKRITGQSSERGAVLDENGRIIKTYPNAKDAYVLYGHVYWDKDFSREFVRKLSLVYDEEETKGVLWERIFDRFIAELPPLYAKIYDEDIIYEFDTLRDLKRFDPACQENNGSEIMKNICRVLQCRERDLDNFEVLKHGQTNDNFTFMLSGKKYVYRHSSAFTREIVNRKREAEIQNLVHVNGFDSVFLYIDDRSGWKITIYKEHKNLDFTNDLELDIAVNILRRLHSLRLNIDWEFNFRTEILRLHNLLHGKNAEYSNVQAELGEMIFSLLEFLEAERDEWPLCLCHNDINRDNFLIGNDGTCDLIDWEYSGLNDKAFDIAKLVLKSEAKGSEARRIISKYYGRECTDKEERHILACGAIEDYYWLIWALYLEQNGKNLSESMKIWRAHASEYGFYSLSLYRE